MKQIQLNNNNKKTKNSLFYHPFQFGLSLSLTLSFKSLHTSSTPASQPPPHQPPTHQAHLPPPPT
jgi:hypothetical protein